VEAGESLVATLKVAERPVALMVLETVVASATDAVVQVLEAVVARV